MAVFFLAAESNSEAIEKLLEEHYSGDWLKVARWQWLISADITAHEIGEKLGISDGEVGRFILMPVKNYHGWHKREIWDWIVLKLGD